MAVSGVPGVPLFAHSTAKWLEAAIYKSQKKTFRGSSSEFVLLIQQMLSTYPTK